MLELPLISNDQNIAKRKKRLKNILIVFFIVLGLSFRIVSTISRDSIFGARIIAGIIITGAIGFPILIGLYFRMNMKFLLYIGEDCFVIKKGRQKSQINFSELDSFAFSEHTDDIGESKQYYFLFSISGIIHKLDISELFSSDKSELQIFMSHWRKKGYPNHGITSFK